MRVRVPVAVGLMLALAGSVVASGLEHSALEPGDQATSEQPLSGGVAITHNVDPTTVASGSALACATSPGVTRDTGLWRVFDLDADHGLVGEACVKSVDYAIELASGLQELELFVGCLPDTAPQPGQGTLELGFVNQVASHSRSQPEALLEFFSIDGSGCCDADTESLVIGLIADDCEETDCGGGPGSCCQRLYLGGNFAGTTGSSYVSAPDCGIVDPVNTTQVCFECNTVLMVVHLDATVAPVPASTPLGLLLTALLLLGGAAFAGRRAVRSRA